MHLASMGLVLLFVAAPTNIAEAAQTSQESADHRNGVVVELSSDQLHFLAENARDFLYRFGGQLDEPSYDEIQSLIDFAGTWYRHAHSRFKHETQSLCLRADQYDKLGLAEEMARIGPEFMDRFSDRIRMTLSRTSHHARLAALEYVLQSEFRVPLRPWDAVLSVAREDVGTNPTELRNFVCKLANERL